MRVAGVLRVAGPGRGAAGRAALTWTTRGRGGVLAVKADELLGMVPVDRR